MHIFIMSDWCPLNDCETIDDCEVCLLSRIEWEITDEK